MLPLPRTASALFILLLSFICAPAAFAQEADRNPSFSPLRLSYVEGAVSFWRPGAPDWVAAQLNIPIAVGDAFYVGREGDLELQMGSRAFIRADDDTELSLLNQTGDYAQFKVTSGRVSFDLRALPAGYSIELDTPDAVFTIDHVGYYRVDVDGDVHFMTRRGGRAMMVPAGGQAMSINPSEEIVVHGGAVAQAETYVVPELDQWDRWNYDRTEGLIDTVSERYLPYDVAGASDLDQYGNWRVVPDYGPVWFPETVPPGWAPYGAGSWGWDPYYQWTWIDDAPWGWAPFHYGRWVYVSGYWAWAPGPAVRHPVYSPALVAFFNVGPGVSAGVGSRVGWVALGWGEPVIPWWGRPGFAGRPRWDGWGGPRVVNNRAVGNTTVINVTNITYNNSRVDNAVVATAQDRFGSGRVHDSPVHVARPQDLENVRGVLPVRPGSASLVAGAPAGMRPPEGILSRSVVTTRLPRESKLPWRAEAAQPENKSASEQRYMLVPKGSADGLPRPEFGAQTGEERSRPPLAPRFEERRRTIAPPVPVNGMQDHGAPDQSAPGQTRAIPPETAPRSRREAVSPPAVQEREQPVPEPRRTETAPNVPRAAAPRENQQRDQTDRANLPGEPANRVYRTNNNGKAGQQRSQKKHE